MENTLEKIANFQLHISGNCSDEHQKIIESYWRFNGTELVNKPAFVKNHFSVSQGQLKKIIPNYSSISFYLYCSNCNSYEKNKSNSQYAFIHVLRKKNSPSFKCDHCVKQHDALIAELEHKKRQEEIVKLNPAIETKNWLNLTLFEKKVLYSCLEVNFNYLSRYYWDILGKKKFILFLNSLENIENEGLLILDRTDRDNHIMGYKYSPKLSKYKKEISLEIEKDSKLTINKKETNTIKLKLTINEYQNHPDSPTFSGIVKFPEKIVIQPNIEYIFGHWQRADDNLYLTLTPKTDLEKLPQQKRISKLPTPIKQGINDFLNDMGENLDF